MDEHSVLPAELATLVHVLIGLNNKSLEPDIGEMLRDQRDTGAKPQPPYLLNFLAKKRLSSCLLPSYHFLSGGAISLPVCLYRPPDLYG